jgi:YVTN family beta-propeller protein
MEFEMISRRNIIIKMVAVSIVLLFLISGLSVMVYGTGPEKSTSSSGISGNISNTNIIPYTQNSSQNNSGGYVKYTLDLLNNTLINGNFVNTMNFEWPDAAAFDSTNGYVYVAYSGSNNVSVINGATNTVIASINVGFSGPFGVAFDSNNGYVYVTNVNSNNVSVINGATNTVIASINVGLNPRGVVFDSTNGYVYVANWLSNNVLLSMVQPIQLLELYVLDLGRMRLPLTHQTGICMWPMSFHTTFQ